MERNQMTLKISIRIAIILTFFAVGIIDLYARSSRVFVQTDNPIQLDGLVRLKIYEQGSNEVGKFSRVFTFEAVMIKGVILSKNIRRYKATAKYPGGYIWRTSNAPVAGFIHAYDTNNKLFFDIHLLEHLDGGIVTPMSINGKHLVHGAIHLRSQ